MNKDEVVETALNSLDRSEQLAGRTADMLSLAYVKRWGVIAMKREQSVAEHSFNVAVLTMELFDRLLVPMDVLPAYQGLMWALMHDVPETLTGDIDGKFKRNFPGVRAAIQEAEREAFPWVKLMAVWTPPWVRAIVKTADMMEAMVYIQRWGDGPRADMVYRELEAILHVEIVPKLSEELTGLNVDCHLDFVLNVVRQVMNRSIMETNCYQMRHPLK